MNDIYVVVWEHDYEGQTVCGAYPSQADAEERIQEIRARDRDETYLLGWIRCEGGQPVESSDGIEKPWTIWNVKAAA